MDLGLQGRVAAVAAASAGLGFASALTLAHEGCTVAICARNPERLNRAADRIRSETGQAVLALPLDMNDPAAPREFIKLTVAQFGRLDIAVANAGGPPSGTFMDTTEAQWHEALLRNLMSTVTLFHAALPHLFHSDQGRLIAITSISAKQPLPGLLLSNAARAAVHGMVKTLSREVAPQGITVNAVCPGHIQTDRQLELAQQTATREGISVEEVFARRGASIPLGRVGDPMEFGAAVAFLCSKPAAYISGVALLVDGGLFSALP